MWSIYVLKSKVLIPTCARTNAGIFIDIEPVFTIDPKDVENIRATIENLVMQGHPEIPQPLRGEYPVPVVLRPAGVHSWPALEKRSVCWTIIKDNSGYTIQRTGRDGKGRWTDDPSSLQNLSPENRFLDAARLIAETSQ